MSQKQLNNWNKLEIQSLSTGIILQITWRTFKALLQILAAFCFVFCQEDPTWLQKCWGPDSSDSSFCKTGSDCTDQTAGGECAMRPCFHSFVEVTLSFFNIRKPLFLPGCKVVAESFSTRGCGPCSVLNCGLWGSDVTAASTKTDQEVQGFEVTVDRTLIQLLSTRDYPEHSFHHLHDKPWGTSSDSQAKLSQGPSQEILSAVKLSPFITFLFLYISISQNIWLFNWYIWFSIVPCLGRLSSEQHQFNNKISFI